MEHSTPRPGAAPGRRRAPSMRTLRGAGFAVAATLALALPAPGGAVAAPAAVPFIADDLERARAEAKRRELPLFVESWAPW